MVGIYPFLSTSSVAMERLKVLSHSKTGGVGEPPHKMLLHKCTYGKSIMVNNSWAFQNSNSIIAEMWFQGRPALSRILN
jgi:hypothetical protein